MLGHDAVLGQRHLGDERTPAGRDARRAAAVDETRHDVVPGDEVDADEDLVGLGQHLDPRRAVVRRLEREAHEAAARGALGRHRDVVVAVHETVDPRRSLILEHLEPLAVRQSPRQSEAPTEALAGEREPASVGRHLWVARERLRRRRLDADLGE